MDYERIATRLMGFGWLDAVLTRKVMEMCEYKCDRDELIKIIAGDDWCLAADIIDLTNDVTANLNGRADFELQVVATGLESDSTAVRGKALDMAEAIKVPGVIRALGAHYKSERILYPSEETRRIHNKLVELSGSECRRRPIE